VKRPLRRFLLRGNCRWSIASDISFTAYCGRTAMKPRAICTALIVDYQKPRGKSAVVLFERNRFARGLYSRYSEGRSIKRRSISAVAAVALSDMGENSCKSRKSTSSDNFFNASVIPRGILRIPFLSSRSSMISSFIPRSFRFARKNRKVRATLPR